MKRGENQVEIAVGGRPFTNFYFGGLTAKPYLMPLRTASGIVISRSFPVGNNLSPADVKSPSFEPHQRPLYFAHGDINGLDFWTEQAFSKYYHEHGPHSYGRMTFTKMEHLTQNDSTGSLRARFNLVAPSGRPIAEETQSYEFRGDDRTRTIDCEFIVYANEGPVVFGDTKEGTFAVRLGPELSAPHDQMLNSNGAKGEPAIWGKPADWVAYTGTVSGKPVTVVTFDNPKSFRHPTTWHGLTACSQPTPLGFANSPKMRTKMGVGRCQRGSRLRFAIAF